MRYFILIALGTLFTANAGAHPDHNEIGMRQEAAAMAEATRAFLSTLTEEQRENVLFDLDDADARRGWSNLPTDMVPRAGLTIRGLDDTQRIALHGMLARGLSSEGYGEAMHIMSLEESLHDGLRQMIAAQGDDLTAERRAQGEAFLASYDPENYWVRIFGTPGSDAWSWVFDGHHLAITATVVEGRIAFTPVFLGAAPQTLMSGSSAGHRALQHELDRVTDLMASFDAAQIDALVQSATRDDAAEFAGPGWAPEADAEPLGLSAAALTENQQLLLRRAIREFIGAASSAAADAQLAHIESDGLEALHLAWWGDAGDLSRRFMLRISGPSLHIDFSREGQADEGNVNHVHIIVRDPANEYGENWLESHYAEAHENP